ncbi:MAG TPA: DnaD domain protein [Moorella mulderi]|nr:DnaD domain protein [Moorella mulderi]
MEWRQPYQLLVTSLLDSGCLVIPDLLLKFYTRLGLTETEMMVIIHLLHWRQIEQERFPAPEKISLYMGLDTEEVKNRLASLIEKKFLTVEPYFHPSLRKWQNSFSFTPLWERLIEMALGEVPSLPQGERDSQELYCLFEKEFGRPLSPLENEQLRVWQEEGIPGELIQEALKRAALRGVLNFRYIDSILRDWRRNNIKTLEEALAYDERRRARKRPTPSPSPPKDKYRDLYRLDADINQEN